MNQYSSKGLSQNWDFIQKFSRQKKRKWEFVSRNKTVVKITPKREPLLLKADDTEFSVKVDGEKVFVQPRKNGKFSGKRQEYSLSVAEKLGII